jgi:hypothetical protein
MMPKGHVKGFRWTTPEARFWKRVHKTEGCWEWTGYCLPTTNHPELRGHGQFRVEGKIILAHRFSWILHNGPIDPPTLLVCHHCDHPPCVRPDHLFLGTNADNVRDALSKHRLPKGEQATNAILTEADVREIRTLCTNRTLSYWTIGRMYCVSEATIRKIIYGENWKHVR